MFEDVPGEHLPAMPVAPAPGFSGSRSLVPWPAKLGRILTRPQDTS